MGLSGGGALVRTDAPMPRRDFEAFPSGARFELVLGVEDGDPELSKRSHTVLRRPTSVRVGVHRFSDGRAGATERFDECPVPRAPCPAARRGGALPPSRVGPGHEHRQAF